MSTEHHNMSNGSGDPVHETVSFETADVQVRSIYWYLVALGLAALGSFLLCIFILKFLTGFVSQSDVPPPPSRTALGENYHSYPPEPRLQGVPGHITDPQQDLRDKVNADMEANEKAEWIDKDAGVAQIPVKDAMKMIAEKGLPGVNAAAAEQKK
jgi:hypothetical protein